MQSNFDNESTMDQTFDTMMKPGTGQRSRDTCGRYLKRFRGAPLDGSNVWTSVSVCTQKYKMSSSIRPLMFNSTPSTVMILDSCEDVCWLFTCWAHCCCSMCISIYITHQATSQLQHISAAPWRIIWDSGLSPKDLQVHNIQWMKMKEADTGKCMCVGTKRMTTSAAETFKCQYLWRVTKLG